MLSPRGAKSRRPPALPAMTRRCCATTAILARQVLARVRERSERHDLGRSHPASRRASLRARPMSTRPLTLEEKLHRVAEKILDFFAQLVGPLETRILVEQLLRE